MFFYQKSNYLTEILFNKILKSIEIQFHHVYHNISFSRSFVRNNHAITETLTLYLISLYFPFFKDSNLFGKKGKKWFEQEVLFQLFNDGSDSQYSFNYHRVKVQLFTLALASAKLHNQTFSDAVIKKMKSSLFFLTQMIGDTINGYLPNFGANDGSLYFKLNGKDYRNYLPQLYALAGLLEIKLNFIIETAGIEEDLIWYTSKIKLDIRQEIQMQEYNYFPDGGYITCRLNNFFVVFKTPEYKFRIGQDDYFHLDVWCDNVNLLRDSGSFKYNTDPKTFNNFNGVIGHNTISINMENHLKKSFGFVWLNKPKHNSTNISYKDGILKFSSSMNVITPIKALISRSVELNTRKRELIVTDSCYPDNKTKLDNSLIQIWNCDSENFYKLGFKSNSDKSNLITPQIVDGQCSVYYGKSLATKRVLIENNCTELKTIISFY